MYTHGTVPHEKHMTICHCSSIVAAPPSHYIILLQYCNHSNHNLNLNCNLNLNLHLHLHLNLNLNPQHE